MSRRLRAALAAAALAVVLTMVGCAGSKTELDAQTGEQWQTKVLAIAERAAAGDPAAALTELAALETETTQARSDGEISAERAAIIQQAITAVRADLEAASVPPPSDDAVVTVPVAPADDGSDDEGNNDENGKKDKEKDKGGKGSEGDDD